MDAIKNSLKTVKSVFEGVPFFKFMMTAGIFIFAGGGLLWLIAGFLPMMSFGGYFVKTLLASLGRVAIFVGLGFAVIKGEELFLMIASAAISLGALIAAIIEVAGYGYSNFELWLFFLMFGGVAALALISFLKSDKMIEMKAQAQVRAQERAVQQAAAAAAAQQAAAQQVQLIECPNCKGPVPINVKFCPNCGTPNPAMQYQAPPAAAPPAAAPAAPPAAAPAPPAAPAAPPAAPAAPPTAPPAAPPAPEAPAMKPCSACGAQIPAGAMFCGQCGAKQ